MNIRVGGFLVLSCLPILSSLMESIGQIFSSSASSSQSHFITAASGDIMEEEEEEGASSSAIAQAHKHFRQIQHISQP